MKTAVTLSDHPCCINSGRPVIGIDEVGRGSLIADVVTAAVIFPGDMPAGLKDSKTISSKKRDILEPQIKEKGIWAIGRATVEEIDEHGILQATLLAMFRAWRGISEEYRNGALVIIDGDKAPKIPGDIILLPKGDQLCPTISAASILAKVCRDKEIEALHLIEGRYNWGKNKGYGTKDHFAAISEHGPSKYHRKSFNPVRTILRERAKIADKP